MHSFPDRLQSEQEFHDQQARERARDLGHHPEKLFFSDDEYLNHESWIRPAFAQMGDVKGKRVLDLGCGHGMASVVLARQGARVVACDLSLEYVKEARTRAQANEVSIDFLRADGEFLPLADQSFDAVWGNAVLHHLDLDVAGREIHRVLRPGGIAVFCEPWGENPFLGVIRRWIPYPGKERTRDEKPLRSIHIETLKRIFPQVDVTGYQLLSMIRRGIPIRPLIQVLESVDKELVSLCPRLEKFCRYVVITLRR